MPLTRITVREGMSDARLQQLSALYHQTLVEVFDVPQEDKFQILEALPARALVYHPTTRPAAGTATSSCSRSWRESPAARWSSSGSMSGSPSACMRTWASIPTTSWW